MPVHEQAVEKVMFGHFFVYRRFIPWGQGMNTQLHLKIVQQVTEVVCRCHPQININSAGVCFMIGCPPINWSLLVQNWFQTVHLPQLSHPAYSPDLNPLDFWLLAVLNRKVCGELFPDCQQLMNTLDHEISVIPAREWRNGELQWTDM